MVSAIFEDGRLATLHLCHLRTVPGRSPGPERVLHSKLDIPAPFAIHSAALGRKNIGEPLRRKRGAFPFSIIIIAVSSILNCRIAFAQQDQYSANFIMTGCREAASLIAFSNPSNEHSELSQFCLGIIVGLTYQGQSDGTICVPVGLTREQAVRAVVQHIDGQPARINENFVPLAIEALEATWPCKR